MDPPPTCFAPHTRPGLLLPDNLAAMEALEDAPEPFFGVMEPPLPSPRCIPQVRLPIVLDQGTSGSLRETTLERREMSFY